MKKVLNFPTYYKQINIGSCGPNAMKGVISYILRKEISEHYLINLGNSSEEHGTSVRGMAKIADNFGLKYDLKQNSSIDDLVESIKKDIPVIILIQAWGDGHYVAAIGYNNIEKKLHYYDPFDGKKKTISYKKLAKRWHDRDSEKVYSCFGMFFRS